MPETIRQRAARIVDNTSGATGGGFADGGAYMVDFYGPDEWRKIAEFLLREGLNDYEAEAVLRSKHMRWSDDAHGRATSAEFKRYFARNRNTHLSDERIGEMADESFPEGRTILVHLNVTLKASDRRTSDAVEQAIMGAIEVGSDNEALDGLTVVCPMSEEIT